MSSAYIHGRGEQPQVGELSGSGVAPKSSERPMSQRPTMLLTEAAANLSDVRYSPDAAMRRGPDGAWIGFNYLGFDPIEFSDRRRYRPQNDPRECWLAGVRASLTMLGFNIDDDDLRRSVHPSDLIGRAANVQTILSVLRSNFDLLLGKRINAWVIGVERAAITDSLRKRFPVLMCFNQGGAFGHVRVLFGIDDQTYYFWEPAGSLKPIVLMSEAAFRESTKDAIAIQVWFD